MKYDEIRFQITDGYGKVIHEKSFYDLDELNSLEYGQSIEVEIDGVIKNCVVLTSTFGDYNIRGYVLTYILKYE